MTLQPALVWIWLYLTIGLLSVSIEAMRCPPEDVEQNWFDRTGLNLLFIIFWPVIWLFLLGEGIKAIGKGIRSVKEASRNKAAIEENQRLKEEIESLKDKLYELEP